MSPFQVLRNFNFMVRIKAFRAGITAEWSAVNLFHGTKKDPHRRAARAANMIALN